MTHTILKFNNIDNFYYMNFYFGMFSHEKNVKSEPGSDCSNFFRNSKYDNHICHKDEKPWFIKRNQDSNQNPVPLEIMML